MTARKSAYVPSLVVATFPPPRVWDFEAVNMMAGSTSGGALLLLSAAKFNLYLGSGQSLRSRA
jgi:hypothetical protein